MGTRRKDVQTTAAVQQKIAHDDDDVTKLRTVKFLKRIRMVAARLTHLSVIDPGTLGITRFSCYMNQETC